MGMAGFMSVIPLISWDLYIRPLGSTRQPSQYIHVYIGDQVIGDQVIMQMLWNANTDTVYSLIFLIAWADLVTDIQQTKLVLKQ